MRPSIGDRRRGMRQLGRSQLRGTTPLPATPGSRSRATAPPRALSPDPASGTGASVRLHSGGATPLPAAPVSGLRAAALAFAASPEPSSGTVALPRSGSGRTTRLPAIPDTASRAVVPSCVSAAGTASGAVPPARSNPTETIPPPAALSRAISFGMLAGGNSTCAPPHRAPPRPAPEPPGWRLGVVGRHRPTRTPLAGPTTRGPRVVARSRRSGGRCRSGSPRQGSSGWPRSPALDASGPGRR